MAHHFFFPNKILHKAVKVRLLSLLFPEPACQPRGQRKGAKCLKYLLLSPECEVIAVYTGLPRMPEEAASEQTQCISVRPEIYLF